MARDPACCPRAAPHRQVVAHEAAYERAVLADAGAEHERVHAAGQRGGVGADVLAHAVHKHVQREGGGGVTSRLRRAAAARQQAQRER